MPATGSSSTGIGPPEAPPWPLGAAVLQWVVERLWAQGGRRPTCKRLALLTAGLLETATVQRGRLTAAVARLQVSAAMEPSLARRLERLLDAPQLDPERIVPPLTAALLPTLLAQVCREHAAAAAGDARAHGRWYPLLVIVDETTVRDRVHVLAVGLASQGIAVPLGGRTWPRNTLLPSGAYGTHLHALLSDVQDALPPELRDHVVLVADRGYGAPRMLDLAQALGWAFVPRLNAPTRLRLADGRVLGAAPLAPALARSPAPPARSTTSSRQRRSLRTPPLPPSARPAGGADPLRGARCSRSGRRGRRNRGSWRPICPAAAASACSTPDAGPSNGFFCTGSPTAGTSNSCRDHPPQRVARLLTGIVLATHWVLAVGIAPTTTLLAAAAGAAAPRQPLQQPHLPGCEPTPRDPRPAPAKRRRFTWGRQLLAAPVTALRTPTRCWVFPDWPPPLGRPAARPASPDRFSSPRMPLTGRGGG